LTRHTAGIRNFWCMDVLKIVAIVAIIGYVIARQFTGQPLRGRRLVVLPAVLTALGAADLGKTTQHVATVDIVFIAASAVIAVLVGIWQGAAMRLESRNGVLWGQMPVRSLWLWLGFIAARIGLTVVASGMDAHLAASTTPLLLTLGLNRLAQAGVIALRAYHAGVPFAPESDGRTFLSGLNRPDPDHSRLADSGLRATVREVFGQSRR
jgi:hypothetical protein